MSKKLAIEGRLDDLTETKSGNHANEPTTMIIANEYGPVDHAWLDAGLLDESCEGLRCRLVVGDQGGIVCDMVTGIPSRSIPHDMMDRAVAEIATHAVVNTDPRSEDPLRIVDGTGCEARIIADVNDPRDRAVPDRRIMTISEKEVQGRGPAPKSRLRDFRNRAFGYATLTILSLLSALGTHERHDLSAAVMLFVAGILAAGTLRWIRRTKAESIDLAIRNAKRAGSMRELERRARLPDTIS